MDELSGRGLTQAKVAAAVEVAQPLVSAVINGKSRSAKVERYLCDLFGWDELRGSCIEQMAAPPALPDDMPPAQIQNAEPTTRRIGIF